ncbi:MULTISPECIES: ABC transporter ATP-binding protein [Cyanophyceae]|uniref:ABC transporter ATP-binding protein/permease n=1 Tax=Leptolyngbya subtilissima DQ-A4 TaxID=2933933 RepID=A0ABV0JZ21_9CYAN|nr:ABC transporter ATP-binding protein [Nodosilinea sp. FACHB-141]MBD2112407.1 ABC transporter ATP-binding protein [Nodosilinea sp. FACHB-141]
MAFLLERLKRFKQYLIYIPQVLELIWQAAHYWMAGWCILLIIQGLLPAASIFLSRALVDSLVSAAGQGMAWESLRPVMIPGIAMVGVLLAGELLGSLTTWVRTSQAELVQDYISGLVHQQSIVIDFACYESPEYSDRLERAREGASRQSLSLLESLGSLLQSTITLGAIAAILLTYGPWLPLLLVISALPALAIGLQLNMEQYQWSQRTTSDRRRLSYYEYLLTSNWTAAELRLFSWGEHFASAYQRLRRRLRREHMQLIRRQTLSRLLASAIALLLSGLAVVWMAQQLLLGLLTIGDLALFYQAFSRGQSIIKSFLSNLEEIYRNSLFISNLLEFLALKPEVIDPPNPKALPSPLQHAIEFNQVSFAYPGSDQKTLSNFSLMIPAGKITAIVGDNGAGKSTLIKLLCRFYDPTQGSIQLDGIDLRQFSTSELRRAITVLFQSPMAYYVTAGENIALGDSNTTFSQQELVKAAQGAGIHPKIMGLPQEYESQLGKWFSGGTDLSGGEWQKLSLARAFIRQAQFIILDEPTSAMDPWAEHEWLSRFRKMAYRRTALVITHRFTLARQADLIYVMKAGKIVESGNHDELLRQRGLYAQSWLAQTGELKVKV